MTIRFYADEFRCAIYEEVPGAGDPLDPESLMNRPIVEPLDWIDNIYFHSDLDYYGVAAYTLGTSISHPAITGATRQAAGGSGDVSTLVYFEGQSGSSDHLLLQHDLGYVPEFYAIQSGRLVPNGVPVQQQDAYRMRWASVYATTTQIRVRAMGYASVNDLAAASATYGAIVFREHAPIPSEDMLRITAGDVCFGQGKFRSEDPHLRTSGAEGTPFAIATGKTAYARNGGLRLWLPNGSAYDWAQYNGGGTAPSFINVEVGV